MTQPLLWIWLIAALLFAVAPGLDLAVAALFFDAQRGVFPTDLLPALQTLRELIWNLFHLVALVPLIFGIQALYTKAPLRIPGRFWGYCVTLVVLGPVALVNLGLKSNWGRARPAEVAEFGGTSTFTPALQWADQCSNNCSFVSGEASAAAVAAILAGLMLWNVVPPARRRVLLVVLVTFVAVASIMRVMKGRHFLSDVVWAWIFMGTLAQVLARAFNLGPAVQRVTWAALRTDARSFWRDIRKTGQLWLRMLRLSWHRLTLLSRYMRKGDMRNV
ncbi:PAP2 (acid phosphatase) superfamily protein [Tritonibacter multivorans]|uniref:PAP2 (Acid phosphatase) superfamily protein n=1 Tax=Tritonibacter multivorans TaxID=928856 RepID=A0A0N7LYR7_9RHOB|nr:phosphatase PAP2 family protein [Tritonibacter multivorans]MDA7419515.1 phosphatase PAP2 family protein [Tritonibacter multivorans]CUH75617.1 PAP2 (acid phosphatase) superfamily protein [Tritonibacter multivorans]SFC64207.1 PAP2 superfamily protein [Tritonibacter multivorans]